MYLAQVTAGTKYSFLLLLYRTKDPFEFVVPFHFMLHVSNQNKGYFSCSTAIIIHLYAAVQVPT